MARRVLILGGGIGGVAAANALRARLPAADSVVVIDRARDQLFAPSLLWLMVGTRRPDRLSVPIQRHLRSGIDVVTADVRAIDADRRRVTTDAGVLEADALVLALGAELAPDASPGFLEAAHDIYTLDGATRFASALAAFEGGRIAVAVSGLPFKCPAAPYEAALLVDADLRRRKIRDRSRIDVYTPEPLPMPVAGPTLGEAVVELLRERGIDFHPGRSIASYDAAAREIAFTDGGRAGYDLLAAVPPHRAPAPVRESALAGPAGWIPVDRRTLSAAHDGVFALGDVSAVALASGKFLPKAGVFAHAEGSVVADQIAERFGLGPGRAFDGVGSCWIELGAGRAAFAVGDFYAEPDPQIALRRPGRIWHLGKVLFERAWLGAGPERLLADIGLRIGGRLAGVRVPL